MAWITEWQHELTASGARVGNGGLIVDFGDPCGEAQAACETAVVAPLTDFGLITAAGPDATEFLNSQFTSNVAALSAQHAQYSGYCNPKGRLLATMLLFREGDAFWLSLPAELAASVAQRLQKYVLRSKVMLASSNADLAMFGITGPQAAGALTALLAPPAERSFAAIREGTGSVITLPGDRYLVVCRAHQARTMWRTLSSKMRPAGSNWWQLQTIRAGIATVTSATQEAYVPQMLALDAYGAVSFDKGCYPGQEIVARMHYLGDLKRRLYYGHGNQNQTLVAGDQVVDARQGKPVGNVVNAAANENGGYDGLLVLQRDAIQADARLCTGQGHDLSVVCAATDIFNRGSK
ncbi:MAG: folate-binding protein YgfZ [Betaproteobacteria bacterium]|jgi:folate-binding protein YgfZ|nr:MAG: folate-binding protein YgfZ [Betaproteobacteria bacterium]